MDEYINPQGMYPAVEGKPDGIIAGWAWGQRAKDYDKAMETQFLLQELAKRKKQMEFADFEKNQDVRDLERESKLTEGRAKLPFLADWAKSDILGKTSKADWERTVEHGPEARKAALGEYRNKVPEQYKKRMDTAMQFTNDTVEKALEMISYSGMIPAQEYVRKRYAELKKNGIDVPDEILDPSNWEPIQKTSKEWLAHVRKLEEVRAGGEKTVEAAKINADSRERISRDRNNDPNAIMRMMNKPPEYRIGAIQFKLNQLEEGTPEYEYWKKLEESTYDDMAHAQAMKSDAYKMVQVQWANAKTPELKAKYKVQMDAIKAGIRDSVRKGSPLETDKTDMSEDDRKKLLAQRRAQWGLD